MSYTSQNSTETIALAFHADDSGGESIKFFSGNLFGRDNG